MRNGLMRTLVISFLLALLLSQRHSGFMLAFVLLFLIPWVAKNPGGLVLLSIIFDA